MSWFNIIKVGTYYHVTSPENAEQIVEHQMIPAGNFGGTGWELPWVKEQFDIGKLDPGNKLVMFFQSKEEAIDYLHSQAMTPTTPKGVIVKCELTSKLIQWPRDIAIHTPTPSMPEKKPQYHKWNTTPTSRARGSGMRNAYDTQLLTTAYYLPSDEDIPGNFEVVT